MKTTGKNRIRALALALAACMVLCFALAGCSLPGRAQNKIKKTVEEKPGFVKAYWCGDRACEDQIKDDTRATSRCIPMGDEGNVVPEGARCVCCGKPAQKLVYWGRAY